MRTIIYVTQARLARQVWPPALRQELPYKLYAVLASYDFVFRPLPFPLVFGRGAGRQTVTTYPGRHVGLSVFFPPADFLPRLAGRFV